MSRLEQSTKPIIERLFGSAATSLSARDQIAVAQWVAKTAMVFEALRDGRERFYTLGERADVMSAHRLPKRTYVWLSRVGDSPGAFCTGTDMGESADRSATEVFGYSTTMAFASLAVQVLTIRVPQHIPATTSIIADLRPGPWSQALLAIHPPKPMVDWPPAVVLNGEIGIDALAQRWRPVEP